MAETGSSHQVARRSLAKRFNGSLIILYLVSIAVATPSVYFFTKKQVYDRAGEDLVLLVDVVKSIQGYVANDLRPHMMKQGIFYSPAFSGIVATSRIAGHLKGMQPQYLIRNASDNPLNPENSAQGFEVELLERFRDDPDLKSLNEEGRIDGRAYLVSAAPKISNKKGCLRCHGKPEKAPDDVTATYGTGSGYGYRMGDVVGVSLVGVPLADVQALALKRSLIVIGGLTLLFALLFGVVNALVKRLIITPINDITEVAKAVSKGDINREITAVARNDEIGDLGHAFELMRRSLLTAMKRMRKKTV